MHHELGGLDVSHLVTNPDEIPDFVMGRAGTLRKFTPEDFSETGWALHRITPQQEAVLERLPGAGLVALAVSPPAPGVGVSFQETRGQTAQLTICGCRTKLPYGAASLAWLLVAID
jgi:hypothetical protein